MKHNWAEVITGAFVIVITVFFLTFILRSTSGGDDAGRYSLFAGFTSAEGVAVGDEIRMAGIRIGQVGDMKLNPETYFAEVELRIDESIKIPADSEVKVTSDGLLGGAFVEVIPGADVVMIEEGGQFVYASGAISLLSLFASFATGGGGE